MNGGRYSLPSVHRNISASRSRIYAGPSTKIRSVFIAVDGGRPRTRAGGSIKRHTGYNGESSNGRTLAFEAGYRGSSPCSPAMKIICTCPICWVERRFCNWWRWMWREPWPKHTERGYARIRFKLRRKYLPYGAASRGLESWHTWRAFYSLHHEIAPYGRPSTIPMPMSLLPLGSVYSRSKRWVHR